MNSQLFALPDVLGRLRFVLAFVLTGIALNGSRTIFLVVLACAMLLDAIDGPIARYLQRQSEQGARLDSVADFSVYMSLVFGVSQLWPQQFREQLVFIALAAASMILPLIWALIKFHTYTSYHTWLVKVATVFLACGTLMLLVWDKAQLFRLASFISVIAGLEQIIITFLLTKPAADVRHVFAVYRSTRRP